MNKVKILFLILAILFGGFMFFYGGYDDSPGAQLLGVMFTIFGIAGIVKIRKKKQPF